MAEIKLEELRKAYEDKLEIAVDALQFYASSENPDIALKALEEMKDKPEDELLGISYKFVKMEGIHSRYEIKDDKYDVVWSTLLSPKDRGDLTNTIKLKVKILRQLHDKAATSPS
jgi:hypothetical protein